MQNSDFSKSNYFVRKTTNISYYNFCDSTSNKCPISLILCLTPSNILPFYVTAETGSVKCPGLTALSILSNLFSCDYITLGSRRSEFRPQAQFEAAYIFRVGTSHASIVFFDVTPILTRTILLLLIVFCTNT